MKYAIYDKATNAYLTTMEFDTEVPDNYTRYALGYNEYITKARLLDTKEEATDVVTRIEGFKFMEKGRFVIHSFDDTLKDQYIISEAGNPTKVIESITVDLDGTINVKYGTMISHWSTTSLEYAITRMNSLQKAASTIYTSWNVTFDIYKVINIIDEKGHTHCQFINVTAEGLEKYSKDEKEKLLVVGKELTDITDLLNKRIEDLEKANYELGERVAERGAVANRLLDENNNLKTKVEAIKKETRDWKKLYENADADREELKNVIDIIHTDLVSSTACDNLKDTLKTINCNSGLDHISMENFLTAKDEIRSIISHVITILESRELNQSVAFSAAKMENELKDKAQKAEKALEDQKKLNDANKATIAYLTVKKMAKDKELSDWKRRAEESDKSLNNQLELNHGVCDENRKLRVERDCTASIIYAIRNAITDCNTDAFDCIESRIIHDSDFNSDPFMAGVRENVKDICTAEKRNVANHDLKNSEIARLTEERDKALEQKEFYKRQANTVYGFTIPTRCCGKQLTADILSGKKIPISKKKYDDLVEYVNNINLTYDNIFCMMDKPVYLSAITESLNDLTK